MKTQIYGTFGPACGEEKVLEQMIAAGMTGMRLNLSHTALVESEDYIRKYQSVAAEAGVTPQILIDMQGPELRVGSMKDRVLLETGQLISCCDSLIYDVLLEDELTSTDVVAKGVTEVLDIEMCKIPVPMEVVDIVEVGDEILLDDGKILLEVYDLENTHFLARVERGGILQSHKSVKIIGKNVKMPPLTEHDIENIKVAKDYGITALMQPFVLSGVDLRYVRKVLKEHDAEHIQILAKIENRLGVENIEDILPEADVIIIARGDLGNDMPLWELPRVQKQIEEACKKAGKPYIVVTQMLASMEHTPVPTRAEVSDIFHAVYHGAWGVMVTGETAIGDYPVEVIRYLANTSEQAELYRDSISNRN